MICENCGSNNIIWDRKSGCIVCGSCGLVLDAIYDDSTPYIEEDYLIISPSYVSHLREETKKFLFNKYKKNSVYINGTPHIIGETGLVALDLISRNSRVKKIYDEIEDMGLLSGRKIKTKVAVAFYLAGYRDKEFKKILKVLNININYIKRIINKISKKYMYLFKNI